MIHFESFLDQLGFFTVQQVEILEMGSFHTLRNEIQAQGIQSALQVLVYKSTINILNPYFEQNPSQREKLMAKMFQKLVVVDVVTCVKVHRPDCTLVATYIGVCACCVEEGEAAAEDDESEEVEG